MCTQKGAFLPRCGTGTRLVDFDGLRAENAAYKRFYGGGKIDLIPAPLIAYI